MSTDISATYLETQIATATPQQLRLALIEAALRHARAAHAAWSAGRPDRANDDLRRCRDLLSELIAGIRPEHGSLARQVLGVYLFLFSAVTEAQLTGDPYQLAGVIRVLEEERLTWRQVCQQLPQRLPHGGQGAGPDEELAPQTVAGGRLGTYGSATGYPVAPHGIRLEA